MMLLGLSPFASVSSAYLLNQGCCFVVSVVWCSAGSPLLLQSGLLVANFAWYGMSVFSFWCGVLALVAILTSFVSHLGFLFGGLYAVFWPSCALELLTAEFSNFVSCCLGLLQVAVGSSPLGGVFACL